MAMESKARLVNAKVRSHPLVSSMMEELSQAGFEAKEACDGCHACCSRFIPMTEFETGLVMNEMKNLFENVKVIDDMYRVQFLRWGGEKKGCPFLMENGNKVKFCYIYRRAPKSCKLFDCSELTSDLPASRHLMESRFFTNQNDLDSRLVHVSIVDMGLLWMVQSVSNTLRKDHGVFQRHVKTTLGIDPDRLEDLNKNEIERFSKMMLGCREGLKGPEFPGFKTKL